MKRYDSFNYDKPIDNSKSVDLIDCFQKCPTTVNEKHLSVELGSSYILLPVTTTSDIHMQKDIGLNYNVISVSDNMGNKFIPLFSDWGATL